MDNLEQPASGTALHTAHQTGHLSDSVETSELLSRERTYMENTTARADRASLLELDEESLHERTSEAKAVDEGSTSLGRPETKPLFYPTDIFATVLSIICGIVAILVTVNNSIAWHLGGYNNQLIVLGFLLSIMNLCLRTVAPMFFCQLEAIGSSRLQNYEAILRFQPSITHAAWLWRTTLTLLLALPIGLSVGYKRFVGGTASAAMSASWTGYNSDFGMYAAPGLQPLGTYTGSSLMLNVTSPIIQASRTNMSAGVNCNHQGYNAADDPPLPAFPQAYGIATLVINEYTAAIFDLPQPAWISRIQSMLRLGESLTVSNTVLATVATQSDLVDGHRHEAASSAFWSSYTQGGSMQWAVQLALLSLNSTAFVSLTPWPDFNASWQYFASKAMMYTFARKPCSGQWIITQSGAQLASGSCEDGLRTGFDISPAVQGIFNSTNLLSSQWSPAQLAENLILFQDPRNKSAWLMPVMSSTMAGEMWSQAALIHGPGSSNWGCTNVTVYYPDHEHTVQNPGLKYSAPPDLTYTRPALRRSPWLYLLLVIQPAITLIMLLACAALYTVPIGKFSTVAILAGVDYSTLPILQGAAFSGKLTEPVQLRIGIQDTGTRQAAVAYHVERTNDMRNDSIRFGLFRRRWIELH